MPREKFSLSKGGRRRRTTALSLSYLCCEKVSSEQQTSLGLCSKGAALFWCGPCGSCSGVWRSGRLRASACQTDAQTNGAPTTPRLVALPVGWRETRARARRTASICPVPVLQSHVQTLSALRVTRRHRAIQHSQNSTRSTLHPFNESSATTHSALTSPSTCRGPATHCRSQTAIMSRSSWALATLRRWTHTR